MAGILYRHRPVLAGIFAAGLLGGAALAGPAEPCPDWSGWYIGAQTGLAVADAAWDFTNANYFNTFGPTVLGYPFDLAPDGFTGGVLGGFNYQWGAWVVGVELGAEKVQLKDKVNSPYWATDIYRMDIDWVATAAARIGYACGPWLFFGKAGIAAADGELRLNDPNADILATSDTSSHGWMAGGGVDLALGGRLVAGLAYNHVHLDMGHSAMACAACGTGVGLGSPSVNGDTDIDTVTVRLGYKLGR